MGVVTAPALPLPEDLKPRMRGRLHQHAFLVSLASGATLITLAATTVSVKATLAMIVYSITVCGVFGVSSLYHVRTWRSPTVRSYMNRLDHSMIYVFIAGSYTPFAALAMSDTAGAVVLTVVWGGAIVGTALKMFVWHAPRWLTAPIYIALGWVGVFVFADLLALAGPAVLVLVIVGGGWYTLGGLVYALKRPDPWPGTFGYHEVFHAFTLVAAICHYVAAWLTMYATA